MTVRRLSARSFLVIWALLGAPALLLAQAPGDRVPISPPPASAAVDPEVERALNEGPKGSIAIRAVQGTKGGPAVGATDVELELFHRNQSIRLIRARLDENGLVVVRDVPVAFAVSPVARIKHANVTYQDVGPQLDSSHPSAAMDVTVYEVTDDRPTWKVTQRTVAVATLPGELDVVEAIEVENTSDRTWMGEPADAQGRRATTRFALPTGASGVNLEFGFHGWCCTTFADGLLTVQMPLMPGKSPFKFSYRIPAPTGTADVRVSTPAFCDRVVFMLPDDVSGVIPSGLTKGDAKMMSSTLVRLYNAAGVAPDKGLGLSLSGLQAGTPSQPAGGAPIAAAPANAGAPAMPTPRGTSGAGTTPSGQAASGSLPVIIALVVGVAIVGGALLLYWRAPGERRKG